MYEEAEKWMRAVGRRKFMGGSAPNLADLAGIAILFYRIKSDDSTTRLLFLYLWSVTINQFTTCISFIEHPMIWKMM